MIKKILFAFALVACLGLSACDGDGDGAGDLQNQFGGRFAEIFNQPATADPVDVQSGDAGVLDFTADPILF